MELEIACRGCQRENESPGKVYVGRIHRDHIEAGFSDKRKFLIARNCPRRGNPFGSTSLSRNDAMKGGAA